MMKAVRIRTLLEPGIPEGRYYVMVTFPEGRVVLESDSVSRLARQLQRQIAAGGRNPGRIMDRETREAVA